MNGFNKRLESTELELARVRSPELLHLQTGRVWTPTSIQLAL